MFTGKLSLRDKFMIRKLQPTRQDIELYKKSSEEIKEKIYMKYVNKWCDKNIAFRRIDFNNLRKKLNNEKCEHCGKLLPINNVRFCCEYCHEEVMRNENGK